MRIILVNFHGINQLSWKKKLQNKATKNDKSKLMLIIINNQINVMTVETKRLGFLNAFFGQYINNSFR